MPRNASCLHPEPTGQVEGRESGRGAAPSSGPETVGDFELFLFAPFPISSKKVLYVLVLFQPVFLWKSIYLSSIYPAVLPYIHPSFQTINTYWATIKVQFFRNCREPELPSRSC